MSLRNNFDAEIEEEKIIEVPTPSWHPSYDPFCVTDARFDIKKLHNRYRAIHDDISEFKVKDDKNHSQLSVGEKQFQEKIAKLKKAYTILGHIFTKFRLVYELQDKVIYSKSEAQRLSLIQARDNQCNTAFTFLVESIAADIQEIRSAASHLEDITKLDRANDAIQKLESQYNHLIREIPAIGKRNSLPISEILPLNVVKFAKTIFETETQVYKKNALKIINAYRKSISSFNFYGHKRADELEQLLKNPESIKNKNAIKTVIATFIKDGKTPSDHKIFSFFRSPSRCSGIDDTSLRGMFIDEFMAKAYYKDSSHDLRIAKVRTLIKSSVDEIKTGLISPTQEAENREASQSQSNDREAKEGRGSPSPTR
jgi:hypothetical protein